MTGGGFVLLVEDDPSLRMLCRLNLELEQIGVREAETVEAARREVAARRPGVVFLDLHLQGRCSAPFLDELYDAGIPVVIVTGSADVAPYLEKADCVLAKPFEPAELVASARRHLVG